VDTAQAAAVPWAELGAQADAQFTGEGLSISATQDGAHGVPRPTIWDGSDWSALGSGISSTVSALAVSGSDLLVSREDTPQGPLTPSLSHPMGEGARLVRRSLGEGGRAGEGDGGVHPGDSSVSVGGNFTTAEGKVSAYVARAVLSSPPVSFAADSDVFTNPWLGLYQVGDSYSLAGTGTFTSAMRTWSIIGRETVLGVKCLIVRVLGHGTGNDATEYYDLRVAQDTQGNIRLLKATGWKPSGPVDTWTALTSGHAVVFFPATMDVGKQWVWPDNDEYHEVLAIGQTLPRLSTGFGPTANCAHIQQTFHGGTEVEEVWWASGIGVVKEVWNDDGHLNGWERMSSGPINNLIAYYPLDGSAADASGNHFHGTASTTLQYQPARRALGGLFNGTDSCVNVPAQLVQPSSHFSIAAWIQSTATQNSITAPISQGHHSYLVDGRTEWRGLAFQYGYPSSTDFRFLFGTGPNNWKTASFGVNLNTDFDWHFYVVTYDGTKVVTYVDGSLRAEQVSAVAVDDQHFSIGRDTYNADNNHRAFRGMIDDVRVYDSALSASEVQQLYALGSDPTPPSFDANSDVFTNPWLGLYEVGDSYSLAGTGMFTGATRSWSLIGRETVLGVKCLVLRVLGHGTGADASEYYDGWLAQDTAGNLRILKITGWTPSGPVPGWSAPVPSAARMGFPAVMQAGQRWEWLDEESEVLAVNQTVPEMSTGFGPTANCVHIRKVADAGADIDQNWWGAGVGVVKEIWSETDDRDRWERIPDHGFASWTVQTGLPGDRRGPTDRNGPLDLPNLMAYALGVNPFTAISSDLPFAAVREAGGQRQFVFTYRRSKTATKIQVQVVHAGAVAGSTWSPVNATPVRVGDTPDGLAEFWEMVLPLDGPQGYFRLQVQQEGSPVAPAGVVLIPGGDVHEVRNRGAHG